MTDLGLGVMVSMKDAFSGNAGRIENSMKSLDATVAESTERMNRNLDRVQKGAMTMGAGIAMMALPVSLVASTAATQKALGEVASLGVKDLNSLEDAAESFSNTWAGTTKAEFISASYDVRSAVNSLTDEAVGKFTAVAALTGKATKAGTQEMVSNFTTAYGIFKPIMQDMTDAAWAVTYAGGISKAVSLFKTNGKQMADATKNIGAIAASSILPMEEQLAVLGQLQTTMPGSEAGTQYKAFISKAAEASDKLAGVQLVNKQTGRLKGIVEMLQELKKRFPDLSQAAAQVEIKKAFGSDEAVKFVLGMSQNMGALEGNIRSIKDAMEGGTTVTEKMAEAMNQDIGSQFQLLKQQFSNLFEILGRTLLPIVTPVIKGIQKMVRYFQGLAKSAPGLTRVLLTIGMALGAVLVVVGGLITAVGMFGLMVPAIKVGMAAIATAASSAGAAISAAFWPVTLTIGAIVLAVYLLRKIWETNFGGIRDAIVAVWLKISLAFQGIHALISSLKEGVGGMSADLAKKLEDAGLLGFVTTVFQVYYRVRQFLAGLWQAFTHTFGRIRDILEPPVSALVNAFGALFDAIFSILGIFGLAATAADASTYYSLGDALGSILGIIAQIGAFILSYIVDALPFVIRIIAAVIRAVVWLGEVIVSTFIGAAKWIAKFVLPVRLVIEAFKMVGRIIYKVWQILSGDISILDGIKGIGKAIYDFLATPFRWARDVVLGLWSFIKGIFTKIGGFFEGAGDWLVSFFRQLPIIGTFIDLFDTIVSFFSGDTTFFDAGKNILISLGKGIWSAVSYPFQLLKKALDWLWDLLPFSDSDEKSSEEGLKKSGTSILSSIGKGILSVFALPAQLVGKAMGMVADGLSWAWDGLASIAQGAWSFVSAPFEWIGSAASSVWSGITNAASSAWEGMKSFGQGALDAVSAPFTAIADVASSAWDSVSSAAGSAWNGIKGAASSAWSGITNAASSAWEGMKSFGQNALEAIATPFSSIADAASSAWDSVSSAAGSAWDGIKGAASSTWDWLTGIFSDGAEAAASGVQELAATTPDSMAAMQKPLNDVLESFKTLLEEIAVLASSALDVLFGSHQMSIAAPKISGSTMALSAPEIAMMPQSPIAALGQVTPAMSDVESIEAFRSAFRNAPKPPSQEMIIERAREQLQLDYPALPAPISQDEPLPAEAVELPPYRAQLLSETRGATNLAARNQREDAGFDKAAIESMVTKIVDSMAERPVEIKVTSVLDGRQVAQSVYKDMREQKIKNYETL